MGSQPGVLGRDDLAGGFPQWTLIGAGARRLWVVEATSMSPDRGEVLIGSWPLGAVRLAEESYDRKAGPVKLGAWRAIRFEFPDRDVAVLQPFGREVADLIAACRAAPSVAEGPDGLVEVALMTTSRGPFEEDVFFVLTYTDGSTKVVPLGEGEDLLTELQELPGFDNETFIEAMAVTEEGVSVLWRANSG
jgi:hypothetical protein